MDSLPSNSILALIGLAAVLCFLVPFILFFITQQNTIKLIQPLNRTIRPGEVWMQLIPIYGTYFQFVVVRRISDSIQRELNSYFADSDSILPDLSVAGTTDGKRPTYSAGMAYCWLFVICSVARWLPSFLAVLSGLAGIAGLVYWIVYWVQLAGYKKKLQTLRPA